MGLYGGCGPSAKRSIRPTNPPLAQRPHRLCRGGAVAHDDAVEDVVTRGPRRWPARRPPERIGTVRRFYDAPAPRSTKAGARGAPATEGVAAAAAGGAGRRLLLPWTAMKAARTPRARLLVLLTSLAARAPAARAGRGGGGAQGQDRRHARPPRHGAARAPPWRSSTSPPSAPCTSCGRTCCACRPPTRSSSPRRPRWPAWTAAFRFSTQLFVDAPGPDAEGVVHGDVYLRGLGDPTLSTASFQARHYGMETGDIHDFVAAPQGAGRDAHHRPRGGRRRLLRRGAQRGRTGGRAWPRTAVRSRRSRSTRASRAAAATSTTRRSPPRAR